MTDTSIFEKQLDDILTEYVSIKVKSRHDDCSDVLKEEDISALQSRCLASIERVVGKSSVYYETATRILDEKKHAWGLRGVVGVVQALLYDLCNGYLKALQELIHSDVFADFLEMADYLSDSGYKDAGAVIAGSALEAHLRNLANRYGISVATGGKPKNADALNAEIVKAGGYSKLDHKNVTAWLGLRNNAAHGNYTAYDQGQVKLLISSVHDFITRNPA